MKKNLEEHWDLVAAFGVLAGLFVFGLLIVGYQHGIIVGVKAFAVYAAVYSVTFAICALFLGYSLARIGFFSFWRVIAATLVTLLGLMFYFVSVVFVSSKIFPQAADAGARSIDPGFWLLNFLGAIVIITAASWSIEKAKKEFMQKAGLIV